MNDLELITDSNLEQIKQRIEDWEKTVGNFLVEFDEYADYYRLIESPKKTQSNQYTRTRVGETIRATEALSTSVYRMITAHNPPYELVSLSQMQSAGEIHGTSLLMRWQDKCIQYNRSLLRSVRSGCLFGTSVVEHPYSIKKWNGKIIYESLDFKFRSLLQCAFDPRVIFIDQSPWFGFIDYMTEDQLLEKAEEDPDNWDPAAVQKAVDGVKSDAKRYSFINMRRQRAGYTESAPYEVITYYGRLRDNQRPDGRLWCVRVVNCEFAVSAFGNPHPHNDIPSSVATYLDFELEPYGYGVGRLGKKVQLHLDANRERYMDTITMALFNMWIKSRMAGISNNSLRIRPNGIIETDEIEGIKAHMPNLNAVNFGIKLEEVLKGEHQGITGASANLQAVTTDSSATEAAIAQNEGMRRVAVVAEMMAEPFIRNFQRMKHLYNSEYLEADLWLAVSGMEKPVRVNRRHIAREVDILSRITTDKDFRPKRTETLKEVFGILTSIRNQIPAEVDVLPVLKELMLAVDINPADVVKRLQSLPAAAATDMIQRSMQQARLKSQEFGDQPAGPQGGGEGPAVQATPAGPVSMTP